MFDLEVVDEVLVDLDEALVHAFELLAELGYLQAGALGRL